MINIDIPFSEITADPAAVDAVARACFAQLPASVVLEVDRVVVTGSLAATLVGHAIARQLESRVNVAGVEAGVLYIEPSLVEGERVIVLTDAEPPAAGLDALKTAISRTATVLATCVIGEDALGTAVGSAD